jgi:protein crumbs
MLFSFTGATCEEDRDECLEQPDRCGQGTCVNLPGSFQCKCDDDEYCGPSCNAKNPCKLDNYCQNGGTCMPVCNDVQNFTCSCSKSFEGDRCEVVRTPQAMLYFIFLTTGFQMFQDLLGKSGETSGLDLALIITPIICLLVLIGGVSLAVFISLARKKRATRGTYSPSQQEYCNPRLELDNVLKPPPEERLI